MAKIEITTPTDVALEINKAVIDVMKKHNVRPQDIMPIMAESVTRLLISVADVIGYDRNDILKVFGTAVATAEIEFEEEE